MLHPGSVPVPLSASETRDKVGLDVAPTHGWGEIPFRPLPIVHTRFLIWTQLLDFSQVQEAECSDRTIDLMSEMAPQNTHLKELSMVHCPKVCRSMMCRQAWYQVVLGGTQWILSFFPCETPPRSVGGGGVRKFYSLLVQGFRPLKERKVSA